MVLAIKTFTKCIVNDGLSINNIQTHSLRIDDAHQNCSLLPRTGAMFE
jgi:hypothetical protein